MFAGEESSGYSTRARSRGCLGIRYLVIRGFRRPTNLTVLPANLDLMQNKRQILLGPNAGEGNLERTVVGSNLRSLQFGNMSSRRRPRYVIKTR